MAITEVKKLGCNVAIVANKADLAHLRQVNVIYMILACIREVAKLIISMTKCELWYLDAKWNYQTISVAFKRMRSSVIEHAYCGVGLGLILQLPEVQISDLQTWKYPSNATEQWADLHLLLICLQWKGYNVKYASLRLLCISYFFQLAHVSVTGSTAVKETGQKTSVQASNFRVWYSGPL